MSAGHVDTYFMGWRQSRHVEEGDEGRDKYRCRFAGGVVGLHTHGTEEQHRFSFIRHTDRHIWMNFCDLKWRLESISHHSISYKIHSPVSLPPCCCWPQLTLSYFQLLSISSCKQLLCVCTCVWFAQLQAAATDKTQRGALSHYTCRPSVGITTIQR